MSVPPEILEVERPVNTIVEERKGDSPKKYAVRERNGYKISDKGNVCPKNGKVIGYIINGQYVPKKEKAGLCGPSILSYGSSALLWSVSKDVYEDLLRVFAPNEALTIFCTAALRVLKPNITDHRLNKYYERCFISHFYPGASLSKNTIMNLQSRLGDDQQKRKEFYNLRWRRIQPNDLIAIDGMLKQDNSIVNTLSNWSYKGKVKGIQDVSVLYAFDVTCKEPICSEVFPGNKIDASNFKSFLEKSGIRQGTIMGDKGFPEGKVEEFLKEHPNIHYLFPLKRNDVRIAENKMYEWQGALRGIKERVLYKKVNLGNGKFLYAFKDLKREACEVNDWIDRKNKEKDKNKDGKDNEINPEEMKEYQMVKEKAGTIVFISDLDEDPLTIYKAYLERWLIELLFDRYKNELDLDQTRVQSDSSVRGSEFINLIATIITRKIINKIEATDLLNKMTYGEIMDDLYGVCRKVDGEKEYPKAGDSFWDNPTQHEINILMQLGLVQVEQKVAKKRGRPKKEKTEEADKPKRKPGRPRKHPLPDPNQPKRKRGRPRKNSEQNQALAAC